MCLFSQSAPVIQVKVLHTCTGAFACQFRVQHCRVIGAKLQATLSQGLKEQFYCMSADKQGLKFIFHILLQP